MKSRRQRVPFVSVARASAVATLLLASSPAPLAQDGGGTATAVPLPDVDRFVRVARQGEALRNLADENGRELFELPIGTLGAVHEEVAGWLAIEVPTGTPVWVYGRYLRATERAGVFEVTSNGVNMRPRPEGGANSFPLPERLSAGDLVRMVEGTDDFVLGEGGWARVWSPPGVAAWFPAGACEDVGEGFPLASTWRGQAAQIPPSFAAPAAPAEAVPARSEARPAEAAASPEDELAAVERLERANRLLDAQVGSEEPDFDAARAAFESVLELETSSSVEARAREGLLRADTLAQVHDGMAEIERERELRRAELDAAREEVLERSRALDPWAGRFDVRGALERRVADDGTADYWLLRDRAEAVRLACSAGRYDFAWYVGRELGLVGREVASGEAEGTGAEEVETFDVERIEVLPAR